MSGVGLSGRSLVPIEDTADEWRDKEGTGLGTSNGLGFGEEESKVAVDSVVTLKDTSGLDTFPGGCNLDQDAGLVDTFLLVKLDRS